MPEERKLDRKSICHNLKQYAEGIKMSGVTRQIYFEEFTCIRATTIYLKSSYQNYMT